VNNKLERKWLWHNFRYNPGICLERRRKTMKISVRMAVSRLRSETGTTQI
jgi:hypothetical protein